MILLCRLLNVFVLWTRGTYSVIYPDLRLVIYFCGLYKHLSVIVHCLVELRLIKTSSFLRSHALANLTNLGHGCS